MAGFYEWEDTPPPKRPWFIFDQERPVFGVAGIYRTVCDEETGEEITSAAIITQEANSLLRQVKHDRMPLILTKDDYYDWLNADTPIATIKAMLKESYPSEKMNAYPIHKLGLNNDVDNLEPAGNSLNPLEHIEVEKRFELLGMGGRRKNRPTLFD
jgi:putative SOS response-associated peptidase YedK